MSLFDSLTPAEASRIGYIDPGATKAAFGPGVAMIEFGTPLLSLQRSPQKMMREAQAMSYANPWIALLERMICGRFVGAEWHLEDDADDEITSGPAWDLMRNPSPNMTRRDLWWITLRHLGVCNNAFWYLDQLDFAAGTPLQVLYVNPARMTPAEDTAGNINGWMLDHDPSRPGSGTPLDTREVVHFRLQPPDWGHFGVGLVESAITKAELSRLTDRQAAQTLASGGRRGGIVSPTEGRLPDDVFDAAVAAFRNIAESPDAAKRNIILKGAVDYKPTSQTVQELELRDLMTLTRDDLFALWNVPTGSAGITAPAGLNSGDARKYDDAVIWQGAIHDRAEVFRETVQLRILSRFEKLSGGTITLELEEPEFDDRAPAYDLAAKASSLPLTNDERRDLIGLDPLPDAALGAMILLPATLAPITSEPAPAAAPVPPAPTMPPGGMPMMGEKAKTSPLGRLRASVERRMVPATKREVAAVLAAQRDEITRRIAAKIAHVVKRPEDTDAWWTASRWDAAMTRALRPRSAAITEMVVDGVAKAIPTAGKAAPFLDAVSAVVWARGASRVTGINESIRDEVLAKLRGVIAAGTDAGLGMVELGNNVTEAIGSLFDDWTDWRAERIARTETMTAYNDAALASYAELGITEVEAIDGDEDLECRERNGQTFTLEEAAAVDEHPNGTLDWVPIVNFPDEGKADPVAELGKAMLALAERPNPAPVVNNYVSTPDVNVTVPPVVIADGAIRVEPAAVTVNVPPPGSITKRVERDAAGRVSALIEEPTDG